MRSLLAASLALIGSLLLVPLVLPDEFYQRQLAAQIERATGRSLAIDGSFEISILPHLAVKARKVRVSAGEGFAQPDILRLGGLEADLRVLPLLRGTADFTRIVLLEPDIRLEIDTAGRQNWGLWTPAAKTGEESRAEDSRAANLPIGVLRIGELRLERGSLTFADHRSGDLLTLKLDMSEGYNALQGRGFFSYGGKTATVSLTASNLSNLVTGHQSPVRAEFRVPYSALVFDGQIGIADAPAVKGRADLQVRSLREVTAWLTDGHASEVGGPQALRLRAKLEGSPTRIAMRDAMIFLDASKGQGEALLDFSTTPKLTGWLKLDMLDLDSYLPGRLESDWSDEQIRLPLIGSTDVDFEVTTEAVAIHGVTMEDAALTVRLRDSHLLVKLREIALHGGTASAQLDVEVIGGALKIDQQLRLEGLRDNLAPLGGTLSADLSVKTRGLTAREIVQNLQGGGHALLQNGAILGADLANFYTWFKEPAPGERRKTEFDKLSGAFEIRDGIVSSDNLWMQGASLQFAGQGLIDLVRREAVASLSFALPFLRGVLSFQRDSGKTWGVEEFNAQFVGGHLRLEPFKIAWPGIELATVLKAQGLDLGACLALTQLSGLSGAGSINGTLPISVTGTEAIIEGGELVSDGPGWVRYRPDEAPAALQAGGENVNLLLQALENFRYEELRLTIDGRLDGEMDLGLHIAGANPDLYDGYPIEFNLNLEGALADVLRPGYQIPERIRGLMQGLGR